MFDCQTGSYGALTGRPQDTTLHPYGSLTLTCRSSNPAPILWSFTPEGSTNKQTVVSGGTVQPSFSGLFTIDQSNKYDLIATMTNVTGPYCGEYECADLDGLGEVATANVSSKFSSTELCKYKRQNNSDRASLSGALNAGVI